MRHSAGCKLCPFFYIFISYKSNCALATSRLPWYRKILGSFSLNPWKVWIKITYFCTKCITKWNGLLQYVKLRLWLPLLNDFVKNTWHISNTVLWLPPWLAEYACAKDDRYNVLDTFFTKIKHEFILIFRISTYFCYALDLNCTKLPKSSAVWLHVWT